MVKQFLFVTLAAAAPVLLPAPAVAQNAPQNGVLVVYGKDPCPTDAEGNEIVVCARRPEEERFRIPKELREIEVTPQNQSWGVKKDDAMGAGDAGIGSCTNVGPGGGTGCFTRGASAANADARARAKAQTDLPLDR